MSATDCIVRKLWKLHLQMILHFCFAVSIFLSVFLFFFFALAAVLVRQISTINADKKKSR